MPKTLSVFLRLVLVLLFPLFSNAAHASNYYVSAKCTSGASCVRPWSPQADDISAALNSRSYCNRPGAVDYYFGAPGSYLYVTQQDYVNVYDSHGVGVLLPMVFTGCADPYTGRPTGNDPAGTPGVLHTGKDTNWAITYCDPGYVAGKAASNLPLSCIADGAGAAATDAVNEQGIPVNCPICKVLRGDPVNTTNGNEYWAEEDYAGAGGNLLTFGRYYNSGKGFAGSSFGSGWTHSLEFRALIGGTQNSYGWTGTTVVLVRPDGSSWPFNYSTTTNTYTGPAGLKGALSATFYQGAVTTVVYTREDGTKETYNSAGSVTSIAFGQGGVLTFSISGGSLASVNDGRGHSISFTYGTVANSTKLTKITVGGQNYLYGYDSYGRLSSITFPAGGSKIYQYMAPVSGVAPSNQRTLLTNVIDENGKSFATITYDSQGRATSTKHGVNAETTTFSYGGNSTVVTNSLGLAETFSLVSVGNSTKLFPSAIAKAASSEAFDYDSNGNVISSTDQLGVMTCYAYDTARNLPLTAVEGVTGVGCSTALASPPSGALIRTWQWHALYALPMQVTGPQYKALFNYDSAGRTLMQAEVSTADTTGAQGASAAAIATRTTTWTYNAQGSVLSVKEPRTDVNATTAFGYDGNQNLVSVTSPIGLVTTLGNYDANGRPGLVTAPSGLQTTLTYDARGRTSQVATGGAVTTYGYDAAGLLVSSMPPRNAGLSGGCSASNWASMGRILSRLM